MKTCCCRRTVEESQEYGVVLEKGRFPFSCLAGEHRVFASFEGGVPLATYRAARLNESGVCRRTSAHVVCLAARELSDQSRLMILDRRNGV